ncbi:unnamed protein product [Lota lota]
MVETPLLSASFVSAATSGTAGLVEGRRVRPAWPDPVAGTLLLIELLTKPLCPKGDTFMSLLMSNLNIIQRKGATSASASTNAVFLPLASVQRDGL